MGVYIPGMEMPKSCFECNLKKIWEDGVQCLVNKGLWMDCDSKHKACPLIPVPDHGRLIDADALVADLKRQCKEVFKTDAVSPDDSWITRNQAYNERLWTTWCESLFDYLKAAPTIIPAEEGEG